MKSTTDTEQLLAQLPALRTEIAKRIIGQEAAVTQLLVTFLAGGHALLEGAPGLAKTLMIRTLAEAVDLQFNRIQFTPDLMPSDIVGTELLDADTQSGQRQFRFVPGPIFANILLADEINRTPPKTQAALLESMQEYAVTYAGKHYSLEQPFFILATQNPIEQSGTFPLPEAQLDRFLLYITMDYPQENEELEVLRQTTGTQKVEVQSVLNGPDILRLQQLVREVYINDDLLSHVNQLVRATRPHDTPIPFVREWVQWGAGPRAGQALILAAKAYALLNSRYAVQMDDLAKMLRPVLRHRVLLNFRAQAEGVAPDTVSVAVWEGVKRTHKTTA